MKKIVFKPTGLFEYAQSGVIGDNVMRYSEVMPDMTGEACGIWYLNLVLPKELIVRDSICCFTYMNPRMEFIQICSQEIFRC